MDNNYDFLLDDIDSRGYEELIDSSLEDDLNKKDLSKPPFGDLRLNSPLLLQHQEAAAYGYNKIVRGTAINHIKSCGQTLSKFTNNGTDPIKIFDITEFHMDILSVFHSYANYLHFSEPISGKEIYTEIITPFLRGIGQKSMIDIHGRRKSAKSHMAYWDACANSIELCILCMNSLAARRPTPYHFITPNQKGNRVSYPMLHPAPGIKIFLTSFVLYIDIQFSLIKKSSHSLTTDQPNINHLISYIKKNHHNKLIMSSEKTSVQIAISYDHLLGLNDIATCRRMLFFSLLYHPLDEFWLDVDIFIKFHSWGDDLKRDFGNNSFHLIKMLEGLVVGKLQEMGNTDVLAQSSTEYSLQIRMSYWQKLIDLGGTEDQLVKHMKIFTLLESIDDPGKLGQVFGLNRHWGYPTIDEEMGVLKVKTVGMEVKRHDTETLMLMNRHAKLLLFEGYRKSYSVYPPYRIENQIPGLPTYIEACLLHNAIIDRFNRLYKMSDWDNVTLLKTFDVQVGFDWSEILADKALSQPLSLTKISCRTNQLGKPEHRRVLLAFLNNDLPTPSELLWDIDKNGFDEDDFVIGVRPKERELKVEGRLFAILTLKARMYFTLTEHMIANDILRFFPQQTMKDDYLTLQKKFIDVSRGQKEKSDVYSFMINIDFEKWNTNMRKEITTPVFSLLDSMYGFNNVILRTHDFFEESQIINLNHLDEVMFDDNNNIIDGKYNWKGHKGGLEGLRQKGWTLIMSVALDYLAYSNNMTAKIMGQGDNQVICLSFNRSNFTETETSYYDYCANKVMSFKYDMVNLFKDLGLPLKSEETWISDSLFMYGKNIFYKGSPVSCLTKKIGRVSYLMNDGYPSLVNIISTLATVCEAATSQDLTNDFTYFMFVIKSVEFLNKSIQYNTVIRLNWGQIFNSTNVKTDWCRELNISPSILLDAINQRLHQSTTLYYIFLTFLIAGPTLITVPSPCPISLGCRGFPDSLTERLTFLRILFENTHNHQLKELILKIANPRCKSGDPDYTLLMMNPYAINSVGTSKLDNIIRKFVEAELSGMCVKNKEMKQLLSYRKESLIPIVKVLMTMKPFHPRLASEFLENTPLGIVFSVIRKFETTRTLTNQTFQSVGTPLTSTLEKAEAGLLFYAVSIVLLENDIKYTSWPSFCSVNHAQELRLKSWQLSNIEGVSVGHPYEFIKVVGNSTPNNNNPNGYLSLLLSEDAEDIHKMTTRIGQKKPYIGTQTLEKLQANTMLKSGGITGGIRKSAHTMRIVGWGTSHESNLHKFLRSSMSCITDINPDLFINSYQEGMGTLVHRLSDSRSPRSGVYNLMFTPCTYIHLNTNTLKVCAKGAKNIVLFFQHALCNIQQVYIRGLLSNSHQLANRFFEIQCSECLTEVNEERVDIECIDLDMPSLINCPSLYVPKELIYPYVMRGLHLQVSGSIDQCRYEDVSFCVGFFEGINSHIELSYKDEADQFHLSTIAVTYSFSAHTGYFFKGYCCAIVFMSLKTLSHNLNNLSIIDMPKRVKEQIVMIDDSCWGKLSSMLTIENNRKYLVEVFNIVPISNTPFPTVQSYVNILRGIALDFIDHFQPAKLLKSINMIVFGPETKDFKYIFGLILFKMVLQNWSNFTQVGISWDFIYKFGTPTFMGDSSEPFFSVNDLIESIRKSPNVPELLDIAMKMLVNNKETYVSSENHEAILKHLTNIYKIVYPIAKIEPQYPLAYTPIDSCAIEVTRSEHEYTHTFFHDMFRPRVSPTKAGYKLMDVLNFRFNNNKNQFSLGECIDIACSLGDGYGGFLIILYKLFNVAQIIHNDKLNLLGVCESPFDYLPTPGLDFIPMNKKEIWGLIKQFPSQDITFWDYWGELLKLICLYNAESMIITCDANIKDLNGNAKYSHVAHAIKFGLLLFSKCIKFEMIIKIYYSSEFESWINSFNIINLQVLRTSFSRPGNSECYLCFCTDDILSEGTTCNSIPNLFSLTGQYKCTFSMSTSVDMISKTAKDLSQILTDHSSLAIQRNKYLSQWIRLIRTTPCDIKTMIFIIELNLLNHYKVDANIARHSNKRNKVGWITRTDCAKISLLTWMLKRGLATKKYNTPIPETLCLLSHYLYSAATAHGIFVVEVSNTLEEPSGLRDSIESIAESYGLIIRNWCFSKADFTDVKLCGEMMTYAFEHLATDSVDGKAYRNQHLSYLLRKQKQIYECYLRLNGANIRKRPSNRIRPYYDNPTGVEFLVGQSGHCPEHFRLNNKHQTNIVGDSSIIRPLAQVITNRDALVYWIDAEVDVDPTVFSTSSNLPQIMIKRRKLYIDGVIVHVGPFIYQVCDLLPFWELSNKNCHVFHLVEWIFLNTGILQLVSSSVSCEHRMIYNTCYWGNGISELKCSWVIKNQFVTDESVPIVITDFEGVLQDCLQEFDYYCVGFITLKPDLIVPDDANVNTVVINTGDSTQIVRFHTVYKFRNYPLIVNNKGNVMSKRPRLLNSAPIN